MSEEIIIEKLDNIEKMLTAQTLLKKVVLNFEETRSTPTIYFSYAWGDENETGESHEKVVDEIYESLKEAGYTLKRDKMDINYRQLISEFMNKIGKGEIILVAISEKYLKSPYCMFELLEIDRISQQDKYKFADRIYPVWVESLPINEIKFRRSLYDFWKGKFKEFNEYVQDYHETVSYTHLTLPTNREV